MNKVLLMYTGLGVGMVLYYLGFARKLANSNVLILLAIITGLIAGLGQWIRDDKYQFPKGGNAADFLLIPFTYIIVYWMLRGLYRVTYKREPFYDRISWYDDKEGRTQYWSDIIVYFAPLVISIFSPVMVHKIID